MFYLENSNKTWRYSLFCMEKGITLIALVITVIVLLILAGVTIATLTGDNGLITQAVKAKFYSEMSALDEQKDLSKVVNFMYVGNVDTVENKFLEKNVSVDEIKKFSNTLKAEIIFTRVSYDRGQMLETKKIWEENFYECQDIFKDEERLKGLTQDISYISKDVSGESQKYIYDKVTDVCFKIEDTRIGSHTVHSLKYAKLIIDGENSSGVGIVDMESGVMTSSDETKCYEPNLNNFSYKTEVVYYSKDLKKQYTMTIKEFLEQGKPATTTYDGETYTFADYVSKDSGKTKVWANIKTSANGLEGYWTWIPRFAYKLDSGSTTSDIIFVDIEDKPLDTEKYPDGLPTAYTVHEAFMQQDGLKGIWVSKYQPSALESLAIDSTEPEKPDLSNFAANDTKLIYYTADGKDKIEVDYTETPEQTKEQNGKVYYFYNYPNKIWANVKCTAYGLESNWVWIPRFAYKLESGESSVILIDTNNKPIDKQTYGDSLPESYTVHEAFEQQSNLKGLWFSKYQPSAKEIGNTDNGEPQKPDLSNFSSNDTKLIYYTADGKNSIEVDYTETPEQTKEQDGKTYYFYNYGSKIWANIKCQANDAISYWTWIPRYAYKLESGTTKVIFVDENDKPLNTSVYGDSLPNGYTVHEAFKQGDGLKGIWFSKYQPSK